MKTFLTVVAVAVVAIVLVEITQSEAQGGNNRRCRNPKPPKNTTEVTCDRRQSLGQRLSCAIRCTRCYDREELQRGRGCQVERNCTCLAKPGGEGEVSTTEGSVTGETTPVNPGTSESSTDSGVSTTPGDVIETTTLIGGEETTTGAGEQTNPTDVEIQ